VMPRHLIISHKAQLARPGESADEVAQIPEQSARNGYIVRRRRHIHMYPGGLDHLPPL